jgi:hypothetical protein
MMSDREAKEKNHLERNRPALNEEVLGVFGHQSIDAQVL